MAVTQPAGVLITDLHFDPLYHASGSFVNELCSADEAQWDDLFARESVAYPAHGEDSSYPLLVSAIAHAASLQPSGVVVCTGDLLRHGFRSAFEKYGACGTPASNFAAFATKTANFVVRKLQEAFRVPVVVAIGNNDTTGLHYSMPPNNCLFADLASVINVVAQADAAERETFRYGAYYAIANPCVPGQRFIVLNTVFWSWNYTADYTIAPKVGDDEPGDCQMKWLSAKLRHARGTGHRAALVMHIPPGYDVPSAQPMWKRHFEQGFLDLMRAYADIIDTVFAGHTHMDDFRVVSDAGPAPKPVVPVRITPAVSPIFYNNPGFSSFVYEGTSGMVKDMTSFFYNLGSPTSGILQTWHTEYSFSQTYRYDAYNATNLWDLAGRLKGLGTSFDDYQKYYYSSALSIPSSPTPLTRERKNAMLYLCAQTNMTADEYATCLAPSGQGVALEHPTAK